MLKTFAADTHEVDTTISGQPPGTHTYGIFSTTHAYIRGQERLGGTPIGFPREETITIPSGPDPHAPPTSLALARHTTDGDRLDLTFTRPAGPDTLEFELYRSTSSGEFCEPGATGCARPVATTTTGLSRLEFDGLTRASGYTYRARGRGCERDDGSGTSRQSGNPLLTCGTWSGWSGAVELPLAPTPPPTSTVPDPPTNLEATAGDSRIGLAWANPGASSISGYDYCTNTTSRVTCSSWEALSGATATTTMHTITHLANGSSLTNGTTYYVQIRARNAEGTSGASNEASATPTATTVTPPPTGGTVTVTGAGSTQAEAAAAAQAAAEALDHDSISQTAISYSFQSGGWSASATYSYSSGQFSQSWTGTGTTRSAAFAATPRIAAWSDGAFQTVGWTPDDQADFNEITSSIECSSSAEADPGDRWTCVFSITYEFAGSVSGSGAGSTQSAAEQDAIAAAQANIPSYATTSTRTSLTSAEHGTWTATATYSFSNGP